MASILAPSHHEFTEVSQQLINTLHDPTALVSADSTSKVSKAVEKFLARLTPQQVGQWVEAGVVEALAHFAEVLLQRAASYAGDNDEEVYNAYQAANHLNKIQIALQDRRVCERLLKVDAPKRWVIAGGTHWDACFQALCLLSLGCAGLIKSDAMELAWWGLAAEGVTAAVCKAQLTAVASAPRAGGDAFPHTSIGALRALAEEVRGLFDQLLAGSSSKVPLLCATVVLGSSHFKECFTAALQQQQPSWRACCYALMLAHNAQCICRRSEELRPVARFFGGGLLQLLLERTAQLCDSLTAGSTSDPYAPEWLPLLLQLLLNIHQMPLPELRSSYRAAGHPASLLRYATLCFANPSAAVPAAAPAALSSRRATTQVAIRAMYLAAPRASSRSSAASQA